MLGKTVNVLFPTSDNLKINLDSFVVSTFQNILSYLGTETGDRNPLFETFGFFFVFFF